MLAAETVNYWILQTVAMMLTALLLPGLTVSGPLGAFGMVVTLAFVNSVVWDVALFLYIPETLSFYTLVIVASNGILFWVLVKILPGISVRGVLPALVAPIVFSCSSILIDQYLKDLPWELYVREGVEWLRQLRDCLVTEESHRTLPSGTARLEPRPTEP